MKQYPHLVSKLFYEPLIITPARHAALCRVLESRMAGQSVSVMDDDDDGDEYEDGDYGEFGTDAIIPVHGVLIAYASDIPMSSCGCGLDEINDMIDIAEDDSNVKRVVFDFRTPGGSVTGLPETAAKIAGMSKETIAFTGSECCSGGMWLASQCDVFYATGSASIGSIGVWCAYLDVSKAMKKAGENMQAISAGKYKLLGAYWKPLSDDEKAMIQKDVDRIYGQFKQAVTRNREIADEFMQGQIFDGEQACEIGLCDGLVGGLDELMG